MSPGPTATNIGESVAEGSIDLEGMRRSRPVLAVTGVDMESGEGIMEASKVANLLVFLSSDASSGITGALMPIDGGICALGG
jgi:NAD(P)-dependent dehydrogenase (short-subunit alcohol dehydrogenase family)